MVLQSLFCETDRSVRALLAETVNAIARIDFPQHWPDLVDQIGLGIQSGNVTRMYNSLLALRKLVKIFEYKGGEQRQPLNIVIERLFPLLQQLFHQLLNQSNLASANAEQLSGASMLHLMCKTFWSCVQFHLSEALLVSPETQLLVWFELFQQCLSRTTDDIDTNGGVETTTTAALESSSFDEDERKQEPMWKCKKWILQILCRLQSRWGNPKNVEPEHIPLANFIRTELGPRFLPLILQLLALRASGKYCTDRVMQLCLHWLSGAIEPASTYRLVKPHLHFVLFQVIHPLLRLTRRDLELWAEDPHEFVRKSHDIFEDFFDPVTAASNLLCDLARKRGRDCLGDIITFYQQLLSSSLVKDQSTKTFEEYLEKDAALHALYALSSTLVSPSLIPSISVESLMAQHVVGEFQSPHGFLRLRACRMFSKCYMDAVTYQDERVLVKILQGTLGCMQDPELPVRIEAAKTLKSLVMYKHSGTILNHLRSILPQVLEQYFRLMDEIGNDEVVGALETIIDQFGDEMAPFALQMIEKLVECFQQFAASGEEDDEATMAAMQCLDAINTILCSIVRQPELYGVLCHHLVPVLRMIFTTEEAVEYLDSAFDIVSTMTYYCQRISPTLWSLYPVVFQCFMGVGWDYLNSLVPVLDNFIGRDMDGFLTGSAMLVVVSSSNSNSNHDTEVLCCVQHHPPHPHPHPHHVQDPSAQHQDMMMGLISKAQSANPESVTEHKSYLELFFLMLDRIFGHPEAEEMELALGCRLMYSLLHNDMEQRMVPYIAPMTTWILKTLLAPVESAESAKRRESLSSQCLNVLSSLVYYNAQVTLETVASLHVTERTLLLWLTSVESASSVFDKKVLALGLTGLLRLPLAHWPQGLQPQVSQVILQTAKLIQMYLEQEASSSLSLSNTQPTSEEEGGGGGGGGSSSNHHHNHPTTTTREEEEEEEQERALDASTSGGGGGGYTSEEDVDDVDDEEYAMMLRELSEEAQMGEHYLYDDEEEEEYSSGLDQVDVVVFYISALNELMTREHKSLAQFQQDMGAEFSGFFEQLSLEADRRQQLQLQAAAAAATAN